VTLSGFKAYLGDLPNMDLNPKCRIQDYWLQEWTNKMLFLKYFIFWTKLLQILWVLHASPPALQTQDVRPLENKIKHVVKYAKGKLCKVYQPSRHTATDSR
jgi:hypothetical protein